MDNHSVPSGDCSAAQCRYCWITESVTIVNSTMERCDGSHWYLATTCKLVFSNEYDGLLFGHCSIRSNS